MSNKLEAKEEPLHKVFSNEYLFEIPTVQRPYSWTEEVSADLLNDLLDFIDHQSITKGNVKDYDEPYFLGSIVLVNKNQNIYEVLDGQQRLTTLTILLAVLRDYLGGQFADSIRKMIAMQGDHVLQTKDKVRLELRKIDQSFFKAYIQEDGGTAKLSADTPVKTDSQKLIRDNALYFMERLNEIDENIVQTLPAVLSLRCYLVTVSTPNFDSAFRIFTVLNDRGLELLTSDIIKARAIGDVAEDEQDDYTTKWEEIEVALGRDRFNKLFEHIRIIIQKRKVSSNVKDEYNTILDKIDGKTFIDDYLIPFSDIYIMLVDYQKHYKDYPEIIKTLGLLDQIDNLDWVPIAIYYIHLHGNNELNNFFHRLERFTGSSMILKKYYNWRIVKYAQILKELESGGDILFADSTLNIEEKDAKELVELLNGDVYLDLKNRAKRYLLLRLDSLMTEGEPIYNYSIITVEHVLPQNPKSNSQWLKDFPNPEKYVHKLGNLVLLTRRKNSKAQNFDFNKKIKSYFQPNKNITTFAITTSVFSEKEWTPKVVKQRQKELLQLLLTEWEI